TEAGYAQRMSATPRLITFDVFGTVIDWRSGLEADCAAAGRPLGPGEFDAIIDAQGELERGEFRSYAEITCHSLRRVTGLTEIAAADIGSPVGPWPASGDSAAAPAALVPRNA